jgi:outer membrane lipoprotein SlyB
MRTTAEKPRGTRAVFVTFVAVTAMTFLATVADASRTVRNSVRGAAIGAGVGALIDGGNGARTGAAAGAVAGAVARR